MPAVASEAHAAIGSTTYPGALAARAQTVVIEKRNPRGMKKSVNETTDRPGRKVRQKAGSNRAIRHTGWASLKQVLDTKGWRKNNFRFHLGFMV